MSEWTFPISPRSKPAFKTRIARIEFSEGYEQAIKIGPGRPRETWQIVMENIQQDELLAAHDFLFDKDGDIFTWTRPAPYSDEVLVRCDEWDPEYVEGILCGLTATFKRVYNR